MSTIARDDQNKKKFEFESFDRGTMSSSPEDRDGDYIPRLSPRYRIYAKSSVRRRIMPGYSFKLSSNQDSADDSSAPNTDDEGGETPAASEGEWSEETDTSEDMIQCVACQELVYEYEYDADSRACTACVSKFCTGSRCSVYVDEGDQNALCEYCSALLCEECREGHAKGCALNPYRICKVSEALRISIG